MPGLPWLHVGGYAFPDALDLALKTPLAVCHHLVGTSACTDNVVATSKIDWEFETVVLVQIWRVLLSEQEECILQ